LVASITGLSGACRLTWALKESGYRASFDLQRFTSQQLGRFLIVDKETHIESGSRSALVPHRAPDIHRNLIRHRRWRD
jgi:hypothetical protein